MRGEHNRWTVKVHYGRNQTSPLFGPFGMKEADTMIRRAQDRYRGAGLDVPKMTKEPLIPKEDLDGWIAEDIVKRTSSPETPQQP